MGFTSPINEYADFIKFIDRTHCNNIVSIFKDTLMYNAVYSIYCVYIALMNIINSTDEDRDEKWLEYKDNYTLHLLRKLNKFNYDSAFSSPLSQQRCKKSSSS